MTDKKPAPAHPLRATQAVPRSDVRHAMAGFADAYDALLAAHVPGKGGNDDSSEHKAFRAAATAAAGLAPSIKSVAVGDVLLQVTCGDEASAAAMAAIVSHTGVNAKVSWFRGEGTPTPKDDEKPEGEQTWVVLVIPTR